jgi:glycosyltransferase involved in cell wall biosynthesis
MEKITFVIPSRNNLEFLKLAYASIRKLGLEVYHGVVGVHTPHDILILDDASTDGTWEWIQSLNDENVITYRNEGPERIGIVGMFDRGIAMARTDIIFAFHADMIAAPSLDVNILKHLKPGTVVSATRIEPPLHPTGPEKITRAFGNEPEEFNEKQFLTDVRILCDINANKTSEGIFAPWCMYKSDYIAIKGHDPLFAPQSKEDSDLFNRFVLNGYTIIQSWDAYVYHFTSRGSRFNKHAGGDTGVNSPEWIRTTTKNARNFIRKWGHFVKHDEMMKPIIPPKYDIGFIIHNCNEPLLNALEPWCNTAYVDCPIDDYIWQEQPNTKFNLIDRIQDINTTKHNNILVTIDGAMFHLDDMDVITELSTIIQQTNDVGEFAIGNLKIQIDRLTTFEHGNIVCEHNEII